MLRALTALCAFLFSGALFAQTTVPNTFTAGTAARASEVNANFTALATAIDAVIARVAALETPTVTTAAFAGTYRYTSVGVGLGALAGTGGAGNIQVSGSTASGTVTLNANGTATISTSDQSSILRLDYSTASHSHTVPGSQTSETTGHSHTVSGNTTSVSNTGSTVTSALTPDTGSESGSRTWSVSNGQVVLNLGGGTTVNLLPASTRMLIGTSREASSSDFYDIHVLVRQ